MMSTLYGESSTTERLSKAQRREVQIGNEYAKEAFESFVTSRNELVGNYVTYIFFGFLANFCCCFTSCLTRNGYLRKNVRWFEKFKLALDRLAEEHDI